MRVEIMFRGSRSGGDIMKDEVSTRQKGLERLYQIPMKCMNKFLLVTEPMLLIEGNK